ncbi:transcriptional regulator [Oxalobacteraceae bacterium CAVE-383]|nr:transcriptional regulator [Oxalobacteraceae bacterium CAVE-383]
MPTVKEKTAFANRLHLALKRIKLPSGKNGEKRTIDGPTSLAMHMTLRYPGSPITPQAADKWLKGRAIPKKDKLETLAKWCGVDLHWLEYGPSPTTQLEVKQPAVKYHGKPTQANLALAAQIHELLPHQRYLIEELVTQLELTQQIPE